MDEYILRLSNITKRFPGVIALSGVDFALRRGEVHALVGENGAGKSTLMKVIMGVYKPDSGELIYDATSRKHLDISEVKRLGISMIYQELNLVPYLSVYQNVYLGKEPKRLGMVLREKMASDAREIFDRMGVEIDVNARVSELSTAQQQLVEIAKALSDEARVMIMDEPSAALTNEEVNMLFALIKTLKSQDVSIIYISHRLSEIFEICDRVTVFRDGKYIKTLDVSNTHEKELIRLMVGRSITNQYPENIGVIHNDNAALSVRNMENLKLHDVSIELRRGEILGIGGLVGSGRTELLHAIFGCDEYTGEIYQNGEPVTIRDPATAIKHGIVLVPEERKSQGLFLKLSVKHNIVFPTLKKLRKGMLLDQKAIDESSLEYTQKLSIKTPSVNQTISLLSGGNQQKVVISKWLLANADIIMFDEPTRGIDVGTKFEMYCLMNELKQNGKSIIMVSSDMSELIGMSDRIVVMCEGRVSEVIEERELFSQERILEAASAFQKTIDKENAI